jgi:hypothetical protein
MQAIAQHSRLPPDKRITEVKKLVTNIIGSEKVKKVMNEMPLSLAGSASSVNARILPSFRLSLDEVGRKVVELKNNQNFDRDIRKTGFIIPRNQKAKPQLVSWVLIGERGPHERKLDTIEKEFVQIGKDMGIAVHKATRFVHAPGRGHDRLRGWTESLQQALSSEKKIQLFVCLIPRSDAEVYSFVKHRLVVDEGIISQCFRYLILILIGLIEHLF